jgi:beta-fructofuranosidase
MNKIQAAMESVEKANKVAEKCPYRPEFHFLAPANWMNDPNGPIFYKGEYHLFYQHNPYGEQWGNIHWGHAKSKDLVHWEQLPIALAPSHELGEEHCFSGSCVYNNGMPTIIYTSIGLDTNPSIGAEQWLAMSKDDMITWEKYSENPIMTSDIHGKIDVRDWRDPYVWKDGKYWFMILGGNINKVQAGIALLYKSQDLIHWEYIQPLFEGKEGNRMLGSNWECPNFFPLGNKHVLIVSPHRKVIYSVGSYKNHKFSADKWHILDHGRVFYAPNTMVDNNGRLIMWGWIRKGGTGGWNGCFTIPRILILGLDNKLRYMPPPELQKLRKKKNHFERISLRDETKNLQQKFQSECLEIIAEFKISEKCSIGFTLFKSDHDKRGKSFGYNYEKNQLWAGKEKGAVQLKKNEQTIKFHVFIDKSVLEIFFNYRECITSRIYPDFNNSNEIEVFSSNGSSNLKSLDIWSLKPIWK